ncbi:hypothetical protein L484_021981 [Morus notabilis]|uniref:Uncharacterized protein n=1 Tax=Morus notabilis TaxID=981085 RepID=W9R931_9ROSA|nr:hypothetical protein L484_021981 [Morus notabilis]
MLVFNGCGAVGIGGYRPVLRWDTTGITDRYWYLETTTSKQPPIPVVAAQYRDWILFGISAGHQYRGQFYGGYRTVS